MFNVERPISVSEVRHGFGTFFDDVRWLYNLTFNKNEKAYKVEDVKRYSNELFEANHISEYIHLIIEEAIQKFASLHPANLKKMEPNDLVKLNKWISISIGDINSEISELIHYMNKRSI